jgi:probable phosphoglycerate mutase
VRAIAKIYPQRRFALPPDAVEIVLVRHGASAHAVPGEPFDLIDGHADPALATEGREQAAKMAERLGGESLRALFTTPLQRTAQTAAPLAERLGLRPRVVAHLREVHLGDWEGGELRIRAATATRCSFRSSSRSAGT